MAFFKQVWTLMSKNFRHLLCRHTTKVFFMAFLLPIVLAAFFTFAKYLFVPPAIFGFGVVHPVKTLAQAFDDAFDSGRHKVVLVDNGFTGGDIGIVLDHLQEQIAAQGPHINVVRASSEDTLFTECPSSLRGVSNCFGAVVMRSSPSEGHGGIWNYTLRTDAEMESSPVKINVERSDNAEEVYLLPIQRAIDSIIVGLNDTEAAQAMANTQEMPYTTLNQKERQLKIRAIFHKAIVSFMGVAFIASIIWITYHLSGHIATERETGMSQLLDAMMPVSKPWQALAARIISHHLSFSIVYAPAWVIGSIIIRYGVFAYTSLAIVLFFHITAGLALASSSVFVASFFKKAQLSGIAAILAVLLLGILAQSLTLPHTAPVLILSLLFPPCAYVYFITLMSRFERAGMPANLVEIAPGSPWKLPGIALWLFLIAHIFIYPLLAALVEEHLYGTATTGRKVLKQGDNSLGEDAVRLDEFTKVYQPSVSQRIKSLASKPSDPVIAVKQLSFSVSKGQIVALLGANGSGKSTTLDAIAGLNRVTSGNITIDGHGGLGIAPQKNVLWDDLTVEEHLVIFDKLKSPNAPASKGEISELIKSIDLVHKTKALARTLSGGQKRKLQLGVMLVGGSAVCCVDEVSSGIDPLSRRKIWDILLAERGKRTLILTTHFLDEADLLADHIAILSKGTLRAQGSSVELKDRLGGGYRVSVHKNPDHQLSPDIAGVKKNDAFDLVTYTAPTSNLAAQVIKELQKANITDYRFSGPTIEDVFLQVAEEIKDEEVFAGTNTIVEKIPIKDDSSSQGHSRHTGPGIGLELLNGRRVSYFEQAVILFQKRWTVLKRNWALYSVAFLLPVMAAGLTSLFVKGHSPTGCKPIDSDSTSEAADAFTQIKNGDSLSFLAGPASKFNSLQASSLFQPILASSPGPIVSIATTSLNNLHLVDTYNEFNQYLRDHNKNITAGLWLGDSGTNPTIAWVANLIVTSPLTAQQFLDVMLTNTTIATSWAPFDTPYNSSIGKALNLVIYMGLALACYPAFFALYPSNERRRFVRSLQYSNGVRPFPLWMAYLLFDFVMVLASSAIVTAVWAGLSDIWYHIEYIFVVLLFYGLASILVSYLVSLFTRSQLATFAWAAFGQAVFFLGYLIAYVCVVTYVEIDKIDKTLLVCHFVISAFMPIGSVARAMFLAANLFATACDDIDLSKTPGGLKQYGGPILYLIIQCLILFGLLLWLDSGNVGSSVRAFFNRHKQPRDVIESDEEVVNEQLRILDPAADDGLKVSHLTKSFGKNYAVENVSFGVKRGEVFALLGPNGAGKSTTISLIRGDLKPNLNGGDVFIDNVSVAKHLPAARANLGVCPQIDALDQMTVREHLEFYAQIRGVSNVEHNVSAVLQAVGLNAFSTRMAAKLSGGNKRKLSLGIALMGNPGVLLLDEPSSGLDAASKRVMWKTLEATVPGRSILLTTHSMEEADALAGRVGILAKRMLALGTPDDLRHRYGDALHVHLVSSTAPRTTDEEMNVITSWIHETLPAAKLESKMYHGQLRFSVLSSQVLSLTEDPSNNTVTPVARDISQGAIGRLVVLLEENKARLGIEHYSVSTTTLDEVFLDIVGQHNVQEENHGDAGPGVWKRLLKSVSFWRNSDT
ncbi:P-loop containing nucleoside triphosphate hydrolase protein [Trichoderma citrinoviride]|uniref:P-loop containing nucleoside triphosphate hydrolase protein n=1 Tax=Trichoderma citrinoviride TaxID=58853 RepID=A0A2T4BIN2_9HYPO|nr:P-loop containing nucleoside triphosphate hydrolase protein [Trichoderma citrinoviride]PTB69131.1 P-loop containing nucleoside triphosphate hydrolase protein [Trichoderma citrinoviride]